MKQETHNKVTVVISIIALILSIVFPYFKENILDKPKLFHSSSSTINLTHYFGNPSLGLNINFINTGEKPTIIKKVEIALFNAKNELILKKKKGNIFQQYASNSQNVITLNPRTENSYNIYLQLNDVENEENNNEISNLNNSAIEDLNRQGCTIINYNAIGQNIQLCDSIYRKIETTCNSNLSSLKAGDYKILFYVYQDDYSEPQLIFGKSFKISEINKQNITKSIQNYKWGSQLFNTNKVLYSQGTNINVYELTNEDIKTLKQNDK